MVHIPDDASIIDFPFDFAGQVNADLADLEDHGGQPTIISGSASDVIGTTLLGLERKIHTEGPWQKGVPIVGALLSLGSNIEGVDVAFAQVVLPAELWAGHHPIDTMNEISEAIVSSSGKLFLSEIIPQTIGWAWMYQGSSAGIECRAVFGVDLDCRLYTIIRARGQETPFKFRMTLAKAREFQHRMMRESPGFFEDCDQGEFGVTEAQMPMFRLAKMTRKLRQL